MSRFRRGRPDAGPAGSEPGDESGGTPAGPPLRPDPDVRGPATDLGDRSALAVGGQHPVDDPGGRRRRRGRRGGEELVVPPAEFRSYYGRQILKTPVWKDDIAYYFFLGGLSAGSALLGAGADLTGRPALRRGARITGVGSLAAGTFYLIHDLGRPERFHHMLRVAKPTSSMSMGTWALSAYGPAIGLAAVAELLPARLRRTPLGRLVGGAARPANLAAAGLAPVVASYTAVLIAQTAVPVWHGAQRELPFVFTASAAASAGGMGMLVAPVDQAGPARRLAAYGAVVELVASRAAEHRLGPLLAEPMHTGKAGRFLRAAQLCTAAGAVGGAVLGRRSRAAAAVSGVALLAGGLFERLGILRAGIASTKDPKYVVQPQRERLNQVR